MAENEKTKGKLLFNTSCIDEKGCGSSDALHVYEHPDQVKAHCYSCKGNWYDLDTDTMTPAEKKWEPKKGGVKDVNWVLENSTQMAIPDRNIPEDIVKEFEVRVGLDPATGEIDRHYYPMHKGGKVVGYQCRVLDGKKFFNIGNTTDIDLGGQHRSSAGGKMLIITEGYLDAMAATAMLRARHKNYRVITLPMGTSLKAFKLNLEYLETFDNVFLALDQDKAGQKCEEDIIDLLPAGSVRVLRFSENDPSDMWNAGKELEFFNALFASQSVRPDGIVGIDDIFDEAIKPVEWGLSWPWKTLTEATYGYRRAEIYGFGAGSGCGKTEGFKEIIDHVIHVHKIPAGVIFLEEAAAVTARTLAGKVANKRFHVPDANWTAEEIQEGVANLKGKLYFYNHKGGKDWKYVKSIIKYMVHNLGIKDIFLDHLTALVAHENDEYKALNRIMEEMSSLAHELNCTIFYISHLRKASGTPHEEGGHVSADQFKGSGAIVFWSNFLFGYERNQQADDEDERNTTTFRILKDRNTGLGTGLTFKLRYDHKTGRWEEWTEPKGDFGEDIL